MVHKREHLEALLGVVDEVCKDGKNAWFKEALQETLSAAPQNLEQDIWAIRMALQVRRNPTIDYSFVEYELAKEHLIVDNLRMENVRYDTREAMPLIQFHSYCIYAFYQVENIINYYYWKAFPDFDKFINYLKDCGAQLPKKTAQKLSDLNISTKLYRFTTDFFGEYGDFTAVNLSTLRKVRNESSHRCSVLASRKDEDTTIFNFFKNQTHQSIHRLLEILADKVRKLLSAPTHNPIVTKITKKEPEISRVESKNKSALDQIRANLKS